MIQPIDRLDDPRVATYSRVGDAAWLRDRGLFVAEGRLVVRRLFEARRFEVDSVLVTPAALAALQDILPEGVPAHWSVYFQADDTDATMAKAVGLGGSTVMEPEDTPYGRLATATDATGALFKLVGPNLEMPQEG